MRLSRIAITLATSTLLAAAAPAQIDWKARIASSNGTDKIKNALYFADLQTKAADQAYKDGKDQQGLADLQDVNEYTKVAADTSQQLGKHEKSTEIEIRKIAKRLLDIKQSVDFEEQDGVQRVLDSVQTTHDQLLDFMFKKKH
ncbi:MAG TPA: hypothetical protein VGL89_01020 [Candidatus Koribacter sp.]|jgi:hypothetical protein